MTTTPPPAPPIPTDVLVPEGLDAVDNLTIGELDYASRKLGVSVDRAIAKDLDGLRWRALAMVAWVWHRRVDRAAKLESWLEHAGVEELLHALRMDEDEIEEGEEGEPAAADEDPTASVAELS